MSTIFLFSSSFGMINPLVNASEYSENNWEFSYYSFDKFYTLSPIIDSSISFVLNNIFLLFLFPKC